MHSFSGSDSKNSGLAGNYVHVSDRMSLLATQLKCEIRDHL